MPNDPQFNNDEYFGGSEPEQEPVQPRNNLTKNQKLAAGGLAVFAFLVVVLWFVQLKNNIYAPLNGNSAPTAGQSPADSQTAADLALKNKDTDGDGLSDYDELYLHKTSPYLDDSDSDGLKDGAEIKNGSDPNCPRGRSCGAGLFDNSATSTAASPKAGSDTLNNLLNQYGAADEALNSAATPALTGEQIQALQTLDAVSLRQMLMEAGMDKATLDKISDADLMNSYSEILKSQ